MSPNCRTHASASALSLPYTRTSIGSTVLKNPFELFPFCDHVDVLHNLAAIRKVEVRPPRQTGSSVELQGHQLLYPFGFEPSRRRLDGSGEVLESSGQLEHLYEGDVFAGI